MIAEVVDVPEEPQGALPLAAAIMALREELLEAWGGSQGSPLRFRPGPVELTLNVGVTRGGKGGAAVNWWLFELGGEVSRESAVTQTIKLTLDPVLFDAKGDIVEVLVADHDEPGSGWSPEAASGDRE